MILKLLVRLAGRLLRSLRLTFLDLGGLMFLNVSDLTFSHFVLKLSALRRELCSVLLIPNDDWDNLEWVSA